MEHDGNHRQGPEAHPQGQWCDVRHRDRPRQGYEPQERLHCIAGPRQGLHGCISQNQFKETSKEYKVLKNMVESEKFLIQPLAYIRGRSFSNIFFIVDEAQNLTPHEIKTIISRAGENTKIVFTGDINQIDTPYLDSQSNGLSYLIDKLKDQSLYSHLTLRKGERSDLANLANELL